ncbi:MAG: hypothetical protein V3U65_11770 [Granulosicoccaceae bacterium]
MPNSKDAVAKLAGTPGPGKGSTDEPTEIEAVRNLLFASDRARIEEGLQRLDQLEQKLSDPETRAQDASEVLVPAMRLRLSQNEELGETLKPVVVSQFHQTARDEPDVMAEALFPILGPALRKMITAMLTPDKNAKKRSYRLEQLFLIEKETGLPVCHVSSDSASIQDADMVSGMLSAIRSFVHEAFSADEFDGLNTLQVGELSVWIEWGPSAVLAAVIRGVAPQKIREAMQVKLEDIHQDYQKELANYAGETKPFELLRPELYEFLSTHDGTFKNKWRNLPNRIKQILVAVAVTLVCLVVWIVFNLFDEHRWSQYVKSVQRLPGIMVTDNERHFRDYKLIGLRDPLAFEPSALLEGTSLNANHVTFEFKSYQALNPEFTLRRLTKLLDPPEGIILTLDNNTLYIRGDVGLERVEWLENAKKLAQVVTGVDRVYLAD